MINDLEGSMGTSTLFQKCRARRQQVSVHAKLGELDFVLFPSWMAEHCSVPWSLLLFIRSQFFVVANLEQAKQVIIRRAKRMVLPLLPPL